MSLSIALIIILLGAIAYQDIKFRAISWWLLPVLAIIIVISKLNEIELKTFTKFFLMNVLFLFIEYLIIKAYFSIKKGNLVKIINEYIGIGDVIFLIIIGLFFSPLNFLLFLIVGLFMILLLSLLLKRKTNINNKKVPLAGLLSIWLGIIIITNIVFNLKYEFCQSEIILIKLMNLFNV